MKILIAEDEALYADQLEMLCEQLGYTVTGIHDNAPAALTAFHEERPDLLISDINLAGTVDGVQLATQLNKRQPLPVIFITSLRDEATFKRASAVAPVAFIVKPFNQLQLQRSIELAVGKLASQGQEADFERADVQISDTFFVRVRNRLEKIRRQDISYLEADGRYSMIHTLEKRKFALRIPLSELETRLNDTSFQRCHRSYLVNLDQLESVDVGDMVLKLSNGESVPLSKGNKEAVLQRIEQL